MRYFLPLMAALFVWPVAVQAAAAPTLADSLAIADRYVGSHQCAGRVVVTFDATLASRGNSGEATGIAHGPGGWYVASCDIAILPSLGSYERCVVIVHEVAHLAHGPEHVGLLDPAFRPPACAPPPSTRADVARDISRSVKFRWRVTCRGPAKRLSCVAQRGRIQRSYSAAITRAGFTWFEIIY
jgi:hypothetical protein